MIVDDIKSDLLKNPDAIVNTLEHFGFYHMKIHNNGISFANSEDGNRTAINLKFDDKLFTKDFVRQIHGDLFSFIIKARNVTFKDVISEVRSELGITDFAVKKKVIPFDGLALKCKRNTGMLEYKTYPEDMMNRYSPGYNMKFFKDHISLLTQKKFGIKYDLDNCSIAIPIRSPTGELMGSKLRRNYPVSEGESKYIYDIPCPASQTLFGYSLNYADLYGADILVGEAEKFVMQCDSYDYHAAVAIASSSLSITQAKLLVGLCPKSVTFMMDVGLEKEVLIKNMNLLKRISGMIDFSIYYWKGIIDGCGFEDKQSPTDNGKEAFYNSLKDKEDANVLCKWNDKNGDISEDLFSTRD